MIVRCIGMRREHAEIDFGSGILLAAPFALRTTGVLPRQYDRFRARESAERGPVALFCNSRIYFRKLGGVTVARPSDGP